MPRSKNRARHSARPPHPASSSPALRPVVQQDRTGCALACVAAITGQSYAAVKTAAAHLGFAVSDFALWSDPRPIRKLLSAFSVVADTNETPFTSWDALPPLALLAIKWHREKTGPAWHWVVFVREVSACYVLDSKRSLRTHRRTDFGRMKPKWFIALQPARRAPASLHAA